jgi:hypothetical protein
MKRKHDIVSPQPEGCGTAEFLKALEITHRIPL